MNHQVPWNPGKSKFWWIAGGQTQFHSSCTSCPISIAILGNLKIPGQPHLWKRNLGRWTENQRLTLCIILGHISDFLGTWITWTGSNEPCNSWTPWTAGTNREMSLRRFDHEQNTTLWRILWKKTIRIPADPGLLAGYPGISGPAWTGKSSGISMHFLLFSRMMSRQRFYYRLWTFRDGRLTGEKIIEVWLEWFTHVLQPGFLRVFYD